MTLSFPRPSVLRIVSILTFVAAGLVLVQQVHAQVYNGPGLQGGLSVLAGTGITSTSDIKSLIIKIITFLLDIVLSLAVLAIIVAGVYLIASNGDEAQKDKAKRIVFYAIAGIILILFARIIVSLVNRVFG